MIKLTFDQTEDFAAYHAATDWCRENGVSYGSMCSPNPTALWYGDCFIAKWKNLSPKERRTCDGTITGSFRNGPVTLKIREKDSVFALAADAR